MTPLHRFTSKDGLSRLESLQLCLRLKGFPEEHVRMVAVMEGYCGRCGFRTLGPESEDDVVPMRRCAHCGTYWTLPAKVLPTYATEARAVEAARTYCGLDAEETGG